MRRGRGSRDSASPARLIPARPALRPDCPAAGAARPGRAPGSPPSPAAARSAAAAGRRRALQGPGEVCWPGIKLAAAAGSPAPPGRAAWPRKLPQVGYGGRGRKARRVGGQTSRWTGRAAAASEAQRRGLAEGGEKQSSRSQGQPASGDSRLGVKRGGRRFPQMHRFNRTIQELVTGATAEGWEMGA